MSGRKLKSIHPGEILKQEFLEPMNLTEVQVARDIGVPSSRIKDVVNGKSRVTAEIALRLARYFSMTPEFWMNLQVHHDLKDALDRLGTRLDTEVAQYSEGH